MMIIAAIVFAFVLNSIASQIFMTIEINTIQEFGSIHEDQMQPDMPNLLAGLIMFGWAFFLVGLIVGRLSKGGANDHKSEQGAADQLPARGESKAL